MDIDAAIFRSYKGHYLSENNDFYKSFYKKTEKIVCAVFYLISHIKRTEASELVLKDTEKTTQSLMDLTIGSLTVREYQSGETMQTLASAVLALEAKLRVCHAARLLERELLLTVLAETDAVLRFLREFKHRVEVQPAIDISRTSVQPARGLSVQSTFRRESRPVTDDSSEHRATQGVQTDRSTMILEVLRSKGPVSIKDISAVIKDCSEKTIQRSLNELIKDGKIVREGDRRWSRYSAV